MVWVGLGWPGLGWAGFCWLGPIGGAAEGKHEWRAEGAEREGVKAAMVGQIGQKKLGTRYDGHSGQAAWVQIMFFCVNCAAPQPVCSKYCCNSKVPIYCALPPLQATCQTMRAWWWAPMWVLLSDLTLFESYADRLAKSCTGASHGCGTEFA